MCLNSFSFLLFHCHNRPTGRRNKNKIMFLFAVTVYVLLHVYISMIIVQKLKYPVELETLAIRKHSMKLLLLQNTPYSLWYTSSTGEIEPIRPYIVFGYFICPEVPIGYHSILILVTWVPFAGICPLITMEANAALFHFQNLSYKNSFCICLALC